MSLWAVVPVKRFPLAKQRLASCLGPADRAALARCMLHDVLDTLRGVPGLAGRLVVTGDADAAALAGELGTEVLAEPEPSGLNQAVIAAAAWVRQRGGSGMLVLPGDAPAVSVAELQWLLRTHAQATGPAVTLVPAHAGGGTNALALSPPDGLAPAFGPDSLARHQRAARACGIEPQQLELPGLGLDLDRPHDLGLFLRTPSGSRSHRLLGRLMQRAAVRAADSFDTTLPAAG